MKYLKPSSLFVASLQILLLSSLSAERVRDSVEAPPLVSFTIPDKEESFSEEELPSLLQDAEITFADPVAEEPLLEKIAPIIMQETALTEATPLPAVQKDPEASLPKTALVSENTPELSIENEPAELVPAIESAPLIDLKKAEPLTVKKEDKAAAIEVSFQQVFRGSPTIYSVLLLLSISAFSIWLYTTLTLREAGSLPEALNKALRNKLYANQFEEALSLCYEQESFFCKMLACGIEARRYGLPVMIEAMKAEGKRATAGFWQRTALISDIAVIAPMIGLLGTVLGMFYAFYDINRSIDSVSTLFDGLGISVGTTVAGLLVAIFAMILQSATKYRLVKLFTNMDNEAQSFATIIDNHQTSAK